MFLAPHCRIVAGITGGRLRRRRRRGGGNEIWSCTSHELPEPPRARSPYSTPQGGQAKATPRFGATFGRSDLVRFGLGGIAVGCRGTPSIGTITSSKFESVSTFKWEVGSPRRDCPVPTAPHRVGNSVSVLHLRLYSALSYDPCASLYWSAGLGEA